MLWHSAALVLGQDAYLRQSLNHRDFTAMHSSHPLHWCFAGCVQRAARSWMGSFILPSVGSQDRTTDCRAWL